jgi:hypothetical protein
VSAASRPTVCRSLLLVPAMDGASAPYSPVRSFPRSVSAHNRRVRNFECGIIVAGTQQSHLSSHTSALETAVVLVVVLTAIAAVVRPVCDADGNVDVLVVTAACGHVLRWR